MNVRGSDVVRKVVNGLIAGKFTKPKNYFSQGLKFIKRFVEDETKRKNSMQATKWLKREGVKPPHYQYTLFPTRLLENALSGNKKFVELASVDKTNNGKAHFLKQKSKTDNLLESSYGWMKYINITYSDKVEPNHISPFGGLCSDYQFLVSILGHVNRNNFRIMSPDSIFGFMRRDKNLPRYLRPEYVLREISRSEIIFFPERIYQTLICMGFNPDMAGRILQTVNSHDHRFNALTESSLLSLNDSFIGQLDTSLANIDKYTQVMSTGDQILDSVLKVIAFGLFIYNCIVKRDTRKVVITFSDTGRFEMKKKFSGKNNQYKLLKYLNIFPDSYEEEK
jgi:hypothetical protein